MKTPLENILYWAETKKEEYNNLIDFSNDPLFYSGRIDVLLDIVNQIYKNIQKEKDIIKKAYDDGRNGVGNSEQYYQSLFNSDD